jgi:hypothetical protein
MKFQQILLAAAVFALQNLHSSAATLYVDLNSANPTPPFTDWTTAATNIQDAIDASSDGDLILVTNGVYQTGGRVVYGSLTNRVAIDTAVTVQSVNGSAATVIQGNSVLGSNAVRCVYMTNGSMLSGFTLTNGGTLSSGDFFLDESGSGVWTTNNSSAIITNCVLIGNVAQGMGGGAYNGIVYNSSIIQNSAYDGGGVGSQGSISVVTNCLIWSNSATAYGGGAFSVILKNCKLFQNTASWGGGAEFSSLYGCLVVSNTASQMGGGIYDPTFGVVNCTIIGNASFQGNAGIGASTIAVHNSIIYYNTVMAGSSSPNYDAGSTLANCCTTPVPQNDVNSITNDPAFVDYVNGDFHLQSNSPCINGGTALAGLANDLDGNPRVVDGFVDIGAYEYQTPGFILPYYWAQEYGLPLDGTVDSDGDGMNNWQEAVAGTNPTNAASVLKMLSISNNISGNIVKWQSVANKAYYLQRSTNLSAQPAFISIYTNFPIGLTTLSFTDRTATNGGPYFYRVGVQ